ncbi:MAG: hypothetical protein ACTSU9_10000 [Promethearchaeota archaeon]
METLDAVLQQQLLSSDGLLLDRQKRKEVKISNIKLLYIRVKNAIVDGFHFILGERMDKFIDYLSSKFGIPVEFFSKKLEEIHGQGISIDKRMEFMMIISTMREYWQDHAYSQVIKEISEIVETLSNGQQFIPYDELNALLSSKFGPGFSLMVNIYVLKEMGSIVGVPVKGDDRAWYELLDKISAEVLLLAKDMKK